MNQQPFAHLNYDQLLQALVDSADLGGEARTHLEACPGCQRQVTRLVQRYGRLGQMAQKMAPEPAHAFRLPHQQAAGTRWRFKPAMALGMVAAMIVLFTVWWPRYFGPTDGPVQVAVRNSETDDALMASIDALVDDALPTAYQEVASASESQSVEELDELIDWLVPSIDEDDLEPRA
jgi:anti-sigma factor RsiW